MPRELEFRFTTNTREDTEAVARTRDIQLKSGDLTLNELRSLSGRPLIEAAEADMPIIVAGAGAYLVTETGLKPFEEALGGLDTSGETQEEPKPEIENVLDNAKNNVEQLRESLENDSEENEDSEKAVGELKQFLRFIKKSPTRAFNFREVPVIYADVLNKFVEQKDYDSARWYAERYLA